MVVAFVVVDGALVVVEVITGFTVVVGAAVVVAALVTVARVEEATACLTNMSFCAPTTHWSA